MIAEYDTNRVTERDFKGKIVWEAGKLPGSPVNVQRLANGNTFVALFNVANGDPGGILVELNPAGKTVASIDIRKNGALLSAFKMADEKMIFVTESDHCVWIDTTGKEIKRFAVPGAKIGVTDESQWIGNIDVTPKGHVVVVVQTLGGPAKGRTVTTIAEYNADGKIVWNLNWDGNRATRLANGNTLAASLAMGVAELDSAGKTVWEYDPPQGYRAVRARQWGEFTAGGG